MATRSKQPKTCGAGNDKQNDTQKNPPSGQDAHGGGGQDHTKSTEGGGGGACNSAGNTGSEGNDDDEDSTRKNTQKAINDSPVTPSKKMRKLREQEDEINELRKALLASLIAEDDKDSGNNATAELVTAAEPEAIAEQVTAAQEEETSAKEEASANQDNAFFFGDREYSGDFQGVQQVQSGEVPHIPTPVTPRTPQRSSSNSPAPATAEEEADANQEDTYSSDVSHILTPLTPGTPQRSSSSSPAPTCNNDITQDSETWQTAFDEFTKTPSEDLDTEMQEIILQAMSRREHNGDNALVCIFYSDIVSKHLSFLPFHVFFGTDRRRMFLFFLSRASCIKMMRLLELRPDLPR